MTTLRVIKNRTNFTFRGTGKPDKDGDEHVGDMEVPDEFMPVVRDRSTGLQVLQYYKDAFNGVTGLLDTLDLVESEPLRRVLAMTIGAAEAARAGYGSQEFELDAPPEES